MRSVPPLMTTRLLLPLFMELTFTDPGIVFVYEIWPIVARNSALSPSSHTSSGLLPAVEVLHMAVEPVSQTPLPPCNPEAASTSQYFVAPYDAIAPTPRKQAIAHFAI